MKAMAIDYLIVLAIRVVLAVTEGWKAGEMGISGIGILDSGPSCPCQQEGRDRLARTGVSCVGKSVIG